MRAASALPLAVLAAAVLAGCTAVPSPGAQSTPSPAHPVNITVAPNASPSPGSTGGQGAFDAEHLAQALAPTVGTVIVNTRSGVDEGSGFVIAHEQGVSYMLTNNHVVDGATKVQVLMPNGAHYQAAVQGADPQGDIAVLRINDPGLPVATFGDSLQIHVGEPVIAIGSPLENVGTVTSGIVSALHRTITAGGNVSGSTETLPDVIQTDAPINPGNSGGPLVDGNAHVIGVNTAATSGGNGIGFAIPSLLARRIAQDLIAGRKPGHPYVGVKYQDEEESLAQGTPFNGYGVIVNQVCPGTPADRAGLKQDDVIEQVDGIDLINGQTLGGVLQVHSPGDRIRLTVLRSGSAQNIQLTLSDRPDQPTC